MVQLLEVVVPLVAVVDAVFGPGTVEVSLCLFSKERLGHGISLSVLSD